MSTVSDTMNSTEPEVDPDPNTLRQRIAVLEDQLSKAQERQDKGEGGHEEDSAAAHKYAEHRHHVSICHVLEDSHVADMANPLGSCKPSRVRTPSRCHLHRTRRSPPGHHLSICLQPRRHGSLLPPSRKIQH